MACCLLLLYWAQNVLRLMTYKWIYQDRCCTLKLKTNSKRFDVLITSPLRAETTFRKLNLLYTHLLVCLTFIIDIIFMKGIKKQCLTLECMRQEVENHSTQ